MQFCTLVVAATLVPCLLAENCNNCTVDANTVPLTTRQSWCKAQQQTCQQLCNVTGPKSNLCDANALTYSCVCVSGGVPRIADYQLSLPALECQQWISDCISANNDKAQASCVVTCGNLTIDVASSPSSSATVLSPSTNLPQPTPKFSSARPTISTFSTKASSKSSSTHTSKTSNPSYTPSDVTGRSLSADSAKSLIIVGALFAVGFLSIPFICYYRHKKARKAPQNTTAKNGEEIEVAKRRFFSLKLRPGQRHELEAIPALQNVPELDGMAIPRPPFELPAQSLSRVSTMQQQQQHPEASNSLPQRGPGTDPQTTPLRAPTPPQEKSLSVDTNSNAHTSQPVETDYPSQDPAILPRAPTPPQNILPPLPTLTPLTILSPLPILSPIDCSSAIPLLFDYNSLRSAPATSWRPDFASEFEASDPEVTRRWTNLSMVEARWSRAPTRTNTVARGRGGGAEMREDAAAAAEASPVAGKEDGGGGAG